MTVNDLSFNPIKLEGLSTDTKPSTWEAPGNPTQPVPPRSTFIETDSGDIFYFSGSAWIQLNLDSGVSVADLEFFGYFLGE